MLFYISFYGSLALAAALFAGNVALIAHSAVSDYRASRRREQDSRSWLAAGLQPRTVEEVAMLEGRSLTGITSDSNEAFLAAYEPQPGDLDGLAVVVEYTPSDVPAVSEPLPVPTTEPATVKA